MVHVYCIRVLKYTVYALVHVYVRTLEHSYIPVHTSTGTYIHRVPLSTIVPWYALDSFIYYSVHPKSKVVPSGMISGKNDVTVLTQRDATAPHSFGTYHPV